MNLDTYERQKRSDYADLADAVASILESAIRAQAGMRLQQIQRRAKDSASLKQKLEKADALTSDNIEQFAKDLAGCRLVFYTNSDVAKFLSSDIVRENFVVDWPRTKIHHPQPEVTKTADLFISNNYVVKLNERRLSVPEYARFRDMWCEIQVQTILNHAWSEMAHDTIYKKPALKGFGGSLMESIDERMKKIMRDFLLPAGYEFQKVARDFERLSSGKALFDGDILRNLTSCEDNNARHDLLESFLKHVLPYYDDLPSVQTEIRSSVVAAVKQARQTETKPIETPFGELPGNTLSQIVDLAADILDRLRYLDQDAVVATFEALCELFPDAGDDVERNRLIESAKDLSKYELQVWKQVGPLVQQILTEKIRRLNVSELDRLKPLVAPMLEQMLKAEVDGTTSTYNALTIHTGAVAPSESLSEIRHQAVELLKDYFRRAKNDEERSAIVGRLAAATSPPRTGLSTNIELRKTIVQNSESIVRFYIEVAPNLSYELLQKLEHELLWLYRHNRVDPEQVVHGAEVTQAQRQLIQKIFEFRDLINANRDFVIYKTLVGYESVFPPAWEDDEFDVQGEDEFRNNRIRELVDEVTAENADEWLKIITRCAQTESDDLATFPSFGKFLEQLATAKPTIAISFLDRLGDRLVIFVRALLLGLENSEGAGIARKKVIAWIDQKQNLRQIIGYLQFSKSFDSELLKRALTGAIELDDDSAVFNAIRASAARHADVAGGLLDKVAIPAIAHFAKKRNTRWIHAVWPRAQKGSLFSSMTSDQADLVLSYLVPHRDIDHRVEDILGEIAEKWPEKVVDFFGARLKAESSDQRYESIPYDFHKLHKRLQGIPRYVVERLKSWFDEDDDFFSYRGGRLLFRIFPTINSDLEACLMSLVETHDERNIEFVAEVLQNYNGDVSTHNLCKSIIDAVPENSPVLTSVIAGLETTGVVSGEFGFVAAYQSKKATIEPWLSDTRERVKSFAKRYMLELDRLIASEQRRGEEDLEMRKRDFG